MVYIDAMECNFKKIDSVYHVMLSGRFTFDDHELFRSIIKTFSNSTIKRCEIDLAAVEYIDSAALGMLLVAREESAANYVKLVLKRPRGQVAQVFSVSQFDSIFTIEDLVKT